MGYIRIYINKKWYLAHRLAWLYVTGKWPINVIDHINRNKADNRFINL
ncbi:HNH endonuclease [Salmonella enterica subsp. enterica serovar Paratyphi C]